MYLHMPPGTLTLILGLLAAVSALPKAAKVLEVSWWRHAGAIFIFCSIAALEIAAISHDRKEQDAKTEKSLSLLKSIVESQGVQMKAETALLGETQNVQKTELKVRTLDVARDVAGFVTQEFMSMSQATSDVQRESIVHNALAQYHMDFEPRVNDVITRLKQRHVLDSPTDCDGQPHPTTSDGTAKPQVFKLTYILGCTQDLERAANKLP
jgi:hypothetical protein